MIVRILGEGRFDVPEADMPAIEQLDAQLTDALDRNDEAPPGPPASRAAGLGSSQPSTPPAGTTVTPLATQPAAVGSGTADEAGSAMAIRSGQLQATMGLIAGIPKPVVAAITGYALGGGLEVALAADFRVAGEGARLGQPEILLGVIPGAGGTQRLSRLVGPAKAKDVVFTGRTLKAAEAHAIGLVDLVAPDDSVYQAALDMVKPYAAGPALALRAAKQAIDHGLDVDLATGLEIERVQFAALFGTEDQRAGMRSFLENGPGKATFTGR